MAKYMPKSEFVKLARFVVENHPNRVIKTWGHVMHTARKDVLVYKDDVVQIKAASDNPEMEVERVENLNPTTQVWEDGKCIRHHGEHCHLTERLEQLADEIDPSFRENL